ncbi:hypothetical protein EVAR_71355_1 [Eumeta japonica]|uniref:Uncharacterized protein n=1 Tax=Eumeta variegata TaxID=151549 RepID=A0A4C1T2K4_EUMVA|nr:hypothetical protein EVAR_71355_1 [Eumeta japonica]
MGPLPARDRQLFACKSLINTRHQNGVHATVYVRMSIAILIETRQSVGTAIQSFSTPVSSSIRDHNLALDTDPGPVLDSASCLAFDSNFTNNHSTDIIGSRKQILVSK